MHPPEEALKDHQFWRFILKRNYNRVSRDSDDVPSPARLNLHTRVQDIRQQAFLSYNLKNCQETAPFLFALGTAGIPFLDDDRNCCYYPTLLSAYEQSATGRFFDLYNPGCKSRMMRSCIPDTKSRNDVPPKDGK
jgi:hypothetical protein